LRSLAEKFAQVAYMTGLSGDSVELQAHVLPRAASSALVYPGNLFPIHATAAGKAIFAFQSDELIASKLAEPLDRFQPETIVEASALRAELARVRQTGFAVIDSELDKGVFAVACPVRVPRAGVLHALGLVGLKEHMLNGVGVAQYVAALQEAARDFANVLSHSQSALGPGETRLTDAATATRPARGASGRRSKAAPLPRR
jgi:DNA-binding IclR family transcriptional regulator